jgi:hypothetical protein
MCSMTLAKAENDIQHTLKEKREEWNLRYVAERQVYGTRVVAS